MTDSPCGPEPPLPDPRAGGPHLRGLAVAQHRLERVLPAQPRAAALARAAARVACRAWDVPAACDAAALVTTELVVNAVRHAGSRHVVLRLDMTRRRLRVEVCDDSADLPRARPARPRPLTDDGRGLWLVSQLCVRWGADPADGGGKTVWAEVPLPADP